MQNLALLLAATAMLGTACARLGGPITQIGPETYQVTHTMGKFSPVKGVRQGVVDRAIAKCEKGGTTYKKLREEMGMDGSLSYTLTFQCIP